MEIASSASNRIVQRRVGIKSTTRCWQGDKAASVYVFTGSAEARPEPSPLRGAGNESGRFKPVSSIKTRRRRSSL